MKLLFYYAPAMRAKAMIEAGEIGEIRAIRMHINTGTGDTSWNVPLSSWLWRFNEKQSGGGELVLITVIIFSHWVITWEDRLKRSLHG